MMFMCLALMAQPVTQVDAVVKMVDAEFGMLILATEYNGGWRFDDYEIEKNTKFFDPDGNEMKEGLYSDVFENRASVPVVVTFENGKILRINLK